MPKCKTSLESNSSTTQKGRRSHKITWKAIYQLLDPSSLKKRSNLHFICSLSDGWNHVKNSHGLILLYCGVCTYTLVVSDVVTWLPLSLVFFSGEPRITRRINFELALVGNPLVMLSVGGKLCVTVNPTNVDGADQSEPPPAPTTNEWSMPFTYCHALTFQSFWSLFQVSFAHCLMA